MEKITISNIKIDVVRKDIKNIHLAVYPPTGRVRIAAPIRVNDDAIRLFAISRLGWIKRQQRKFVEQERLSPREYKDRESHYFLGKRYLLNVIEHDAPGKVEIRNKSYIDLYVRKDSMFEYKKSIMTEWYRKELKKIIPGILERWQKKTGIQVDDWCVKQMKTKWGSCTIEKNRIWLNLELVKKPIHCVEYIIVHEMVHLLERHHNDAFTAYMDKFLPNWRFLKGELNRSPLRHEHWTY